MGLLGLGVTAGAAFAALKVAQKYEETKRLMLRGSRWAEPRTYPRAACWRYCPRGGRRASDAGAKVKEAVAGTAEKAGVDTVELKGALHDAGDALYEGRRGGGRWFGVCRICG
ncbi:MAG: hypothetical protein ACLUJ0_08560 [Ruthenibacterium lactatiformans]